MSNKRGNLDSMSTPRNSRRVASSSRVNYGEVDTEDSREITEEDNDSSVMIPKSRRETSSRTRKKPEVGESEEDASVVRETSRNKRKAEAQETEETITSHRESSRTRRKQDSSIGDMEKESHNTSAGESERSQRLRNKTLNSSVNSSREGRRRKHSEIEEEEQAPVDTDKNEAQKNKSQQEAEERLTPKHKRARRSDEKDRTISQNHEVVERHTRRNNEVEETSRTRKSKRIEEQPDPVNLRSKKSRLSRNLSSSDAAAAGLRRSLRGVANGPEEEEHENEEDG